jgi:hypothetical protein
MENFASVLEAVIDDTAVEHVIIARMGDMLGPQGYLHESRAVRHLKKMVPAYSLPAAMTVHDRASGRWRCAIAAGAAQPRRHRLSAVHRWHHRRFQGRHAHARQYGRQHAAVIGLAGQAHQRRRGNHRHCPAPLPYLRADRELPGVSQVRRAQPADHQSARHGRFRQGTGQVPKFTHHRGQHPVQRPAQYARGSRSRLLQPAHDAWRRHGRAAGRGRALEESPPACR